MILKDNVYLYRNPQKSEIVSYVVSFYIISSSSLLQLTSSTRSGWVSASRPNPVSFWRALPVTSCCFNSLLTARGRHSTKNKKDTTPSTCHSHQSARIVLGEGRGGGVKRQALVQGGLSSGCRGL